MAIFTDGTPFVMMAPVTLPEMLHASEDYYVHWGLTTFVRFFRYASFAISMFAPAVYIALINYHAEMLPHALLHNIAASRKASPFPPRSKPSSCCLSSRCCVRRASGCPASSARP